MPWIRKKAPGAKPVEVDGALAHQLVNSGEYEWVSETVPVETGHGVMEVPAGDVERAKTVAGVTEPTPEGLAEAQYKATDEDLYGGSGSRVGAFLENIAEGVAPGLYSGITRATDPMEARRMGRRREALPVTTGAGRGIGMAGQAAATGGVLDKAMAVGKQFGGRVGGVLAGTIASGTEASAFAAGEAASEHFTGMDDVELEKVMSSMGHAASDAFVLGGGLFAAASGVAGTLKRAKKLVAGDEVGKTKFDEGWDKLESEGGELFEPIKGDSIAEAKAKREEAARMAASFPAHGTPERAAAIREMAEAGETEMLGRMGVEDLSRYNDDAGDLFLLGDPSARKVTHESRKKIRSELDTPETLASNPKAVKKALESEREQIQRIASKQEAEVLEEARLADAEVASEVTRKANEARAEANKALSERTKKSAATQKERVARAKAAAEKAEEKFKAAQDLKASREKTRLEKAREKFAKKIDAATEAERKAKEAYESAPTPKTEASRKAKWETARKSRKAAEDAWAKEKFRIKEGRIDRRLADDVAHEADLKELTRRADVQQRKLDDALDELAAAKDDLDGKVRVELDGYEAALYRDIRGEKGKRSQKVRLTPDEVDEFVKAIDDAPLDERRSAAYQRLSEWHARNTSISEMFDAVYFKPEKVAKGTGISDMLNVGAGSAATAFLSGILPGGWAAAGAAAMVPMAWRKLSTRLSGKMAGAAAEVSHRTARALDALISGTEAIKPALPRAAAVLASNPFSEETPKEPKRRYRNEQDKIIANYEKRSAELMQKMTMGEDGNPRLRPEARRKIYDALEGLRLADPIMADKAEAHVARRLEFLAAKLPKRPDVAGSLWRPPMMAIREFARYKAAVENPVGVIERAAAGTITSEDAEAYRETNPEQFRELLMKVIENMEQIRKLPAKNRIALSILTGMPVEPALDPRILRQLQASYKAEPGTGGGMQQATPQPQFGSVKKPNPTQAQRWASGESVA